MNKLMLIDAAHEEQVRVAVINRFSGRSEVNEIEEYEAESIQEVQTKSCVYLAKVSRVEISLQVAFVTYSDKKKKGFLPFDRIHPLYYQIPVEDRKKLLEHMPSNLMRSVSGDIYGKKSSSSDDEESGFDLINGNDSSDSTGNTDDRSGFRKKRQARNDLGKKYNIQEVIKPNQVLLVQVLKDERGNKGASLTTMISLAGKYCVLMPNNFSFIGISHKIKDQKVRRRIKSTLDKMNVPENMGIIVRTSGAFKNKTDLKKDINYLIRLWSTIRDMTLKSIAPKIVYEEANVIKRALRDLYNKDIDRVEVEGSAGYKEAKEFMKIILPSHAKRIREYKEDMPIFARHNIENAISRIYDECVDLPSGGYIVINQTEALISIDVNSGKFNKEKNLENTVYITNIEAAKEIAMQLKLRDLSGLIVIDFIDMGSKVNIKLVERELKNCLKSDRARIRVGKISQFGLLEMSRQRIKKSALEVSTIPCKKCSGNGKVINSCHVAISIIKEIRRTMCVRLAKKKGFTVKVLTTVSSADYLLNNKRSCISDLENEFGVKVQINPDYRDRKSVV